MGNYKFKLSDMLPNAWFYKLKDINTTKLKLKVKEKQSSKEPIIMQPHIIMSERKSYHFTRTRVVERKSSVNITCSDKKLSEPVPESEPPRKSSKRRSYRNTKLRNKPVSTPNHRRITSSSVSSGYATLESISVQTKSPYFSSSSSSSSEHDSMLPEYGSDDQIVEDVHDHMVSLPPIITTNKQHHHHKLVNTTSPVIMKRFPLNSSSSSHSPGVRLRTNTPRIVNRRRKTTTTTTTTHDQGSSSKRGLGVYESYAVVKSSKDPSKDFRESMVEMIVENNIRGSKDFEDLLACYLSLNPNHYHHLIITVFKQIWFDFINHVTGESRTHNFRSIS